MIRSVFSAALFVLFAAAPLATWGQPMADIPWRTDFETAKADAAKENKLIFMDIYATWCPPCKELDNSTWPDAGVKKALSDLIPVKIDADKAPEIAEKYSDGGLPTLAVLSADGRLLDSFGGYLDPSQFKEWLGEARKSGDKMTELEAKLKTNPADLDAALELANRYIRVHESPRALELIKAIPADALSSSPPAMQADLLYTRGTSEFDTEDFTAAVATLRQFTRDYGDDPRSADMGQSIMQAIYLGAKKAYHAGDYEAARKGYTELAGFTTVPGVTEAATRELARIDLIGKPAPALDVAEWINNDPVDLANLKGNVVVLDFFQIVDPATEEAAPTIAELHTKHATDGMDVVSIAVAFDMKEKQQPDDIKAFVNKNEYPHPVAIDKDLEKTFLAYSGLGSPWTVILDREGKVAYVDFFDAERVTAKVEALLKK